MLLSHPLLLICRLRILGLLKRQAWDVVSIGMNSSLLVLLVVFWTASFVTAASNNGICYNKNRVQEPTRLACNPEAEVSSCCPSGDICLSNGICQNSTSNITPYWTGTCTDYMWNSPSACPEICNNANIRQVASLPDVLSECIIQHMFHLQRARLIFKLTLVCCTSKTPYHLHHYIDMNRCHTRRSYFIL